LTKELATKAAAAPAAPAAPAAEPVAPVVEAPKAFEFNDDQKAVIADFEKEWPDVAKAFDAR
jgi:hypothetical protein